MSKQVTGFGGSSKKAPNYLTTSIGTLFPAMVIVGFAMGYLVDDLLDTQPIFMISIGLLGIVGGFVRVHQIVNQMHKKADSE